MEQNQVAGSAAQSETAAGPALTDGFHVVIEALKANDNVSVCLANCGLRRTIRFNTCCSLKTKKEPHSTNHIRHRLGIR